MTAASKLGTAFRHLGSLLSTRAVRTEDEARATFATDAGAFAKRADEIAAEALRLERSLTD